MNIFERSAYWFHMLQSDPRKGIRMADVRETIKIALALVNLYSTLLYLVDGFYAFLICWLKRGRYENMGRNGLETEVNPKDRI